MAAAAIESERVISKYHEVDDAEERACRDVISRRGAYHASSRRHGHEGFECMMKARHADARAHFSIIPSGSRRGLR